MDAGNEALQKEEWRMASSYGVEVSDQSRVRNPKTGHILTASGDYLRVTWGSDGMKREFVHKLVADAFLDKPPVDLCIVDHIDGDKLNNHWTNLRYCSASVNSRNRGVNKNNTSGERCVGYKNGKWVASWYEGKKRAQKSFPVKLYGDEIAKALAIDYRIQKETEMGGYPLRTPKFFCFHGDKIFAMSQAGTK
jgi:hypothetical protein